MRSAGAVVAVTSLLLWFTGCEPGTDGVEYETLEPGVEVLRLWEIVEPESPQIAIFRLSEGTHEAFHRDPATFVNARNVFPQPLRVGAECLQPAEGFGLDAVALDAFRVQAMGLLGSPAGHGFPFWMGPSYATRMVSLYESVCPRQTSRLDVTTLSTSQNPSSFPRMPLQTARPRTRRFQSHARTFITRAGPRARWPGRTLGLCGIGLLPPPWRTARD